MKRELSHKESSRMAVLGFVEWLIQNGERPLPVAVGTMGKLRDMANAYCEGRGWDEESQPFSPDQMLVDQANAPEWDGVSAMVFQGEQHALVRLRGFITLRYDVRMTIPLATLEETPGAVIDAISLPGRALDWFSDHLPVILDNLP